MHAKSRPRLENGRARQRSKDTVDTILAATARVLVKQGFDGLTTNAVAEAAGVSIGSLYQYFPNKEALVAALIERHVEDMNAAILCELARVAQPADREAARAVIELTIRAHARRSRAAPRADRAGPARRPARAPARARRDLPSHGRGRPRRAQARARDSRIPISPRSSAVSAIEAIVHRSALLSPSACGSAPRRRGDARS